LRLEVADGDVSVIVPVILSGGSGSRLWPLSTAERPKQFLPIVGTDSLIRQTLSRVADRQRFEAPVIVANVSHEQDCREEMQGLDEATLVLEPIARNTAAAIAMAAIVVSRVHGPDATMLVMPSDHVIARTDQFEAAVDVAEEAARAGRLVTFGVTPTGPETGYGYIEAGDPIGSDAQVFGVKRFTEKPQLETAEAMLAAGNHFWNGGIFLFRASDLFEELDRFAPQIARCARNAVESSVKRNNVVVADAAALEPCPNLSIDYAVMERSDRVAMVPLDAGWSDVGSWDAVAGLDDKPTLHNLVDCEGVYVRAEGLKVTAKGLRDVVIVVANGQLLVLPRALSQDMKELIAHGSEKRADHLGNAS
jgi:mannose-1-phosphate guanylyltransferase/mannose-6-phosphate isomerase